MSGSVASAGGLRWFEGIDRKLWMILAVTYVGWLLDSMDLNLFTVVLVPSLRANCSGRRPRRKRSAIMAAPSPRCSCWAGASAD